jgi:hypothetical protein
MNVDIASPVKSVDILSANRKIKKGEEIYIDYCQHLRGSARKDFLKKYNISE